MTFKLLRSSFLLMAFVAVFVTSCKKDEDPVESFRGTWDSSSLMINGQETIGISMARMTIEFGEYNGTEGSVTVTTQEIGSDAEIESGSYTMSDNEDVITLSVDQENNVFNYDMDGNTVTLTGVSDNVSGYVIVMNK